MSCHRMLSYRHLRLHVCGFPLLEKEGGKSVDKIKIGI